MNVINGISNLANEWPKPLILYIMDYVPYLLLIILGLVYSIIYVIGWKNWLMEKE